MILSFYIHSVDSGHVPTFHYLPAEGLTPRAGMALVLAGGKLAAAGAAKPEFISMAERREACGEGELIPVALVTDGTVYETTSTESFAAVKLGDKVTLSGDGMQVTAAKGGAAQVVGIGGTEAGGIVRVRFVQPTATPAG